MKQVAMAITGVLLATTLVLPGRQTPAIVGNFFKGVTGLAKVSTGR